MTSNVEQDGYATGLREGRVIPDLLLADPEG